MTTNPKNLSADRRDEPIHEMRAFETWDVNEVHDAEDQPWVRPTSLDAPPARPGFAQRWIRVGVMGSDDPTNVSRKFREGWRPRLASTVPASYHPPTIAHGKYTGCIGVEGMLLCEMPKALQAKRNKYYASKAAEQEGALERQLAEHSNSIMPITQQRESRVVRNVKVADDD